MEVMEAQWYANELGGATLYYKGRALAIITKFQPPDDYTVRYSYKDMADESHSLTATLEWVQLQVERTLVSNLTKRITNLWHEQDAVSKLVFRRMSQPV